MDKRIDSLAIFDDQTWRQLTVESVAGVMKVIGAVPFDPSLLPTGETITDALDSVACRLRGKAGAYRVLGALDGVDIEKSVIFIFALGASLGECLGRHGFVINHVPSEGN